METRPFILGLGCQLLLHVKNTEIHAVVSISLETFQYVVLALFHGTVKGKKKLGFFWGSPLCGLFSCPLIVQWSQVLFGPVQQLYSCYQPKKKTCKLGLCVHSRSQKIWPLL